MEGYQNEEEGLRRDGYPSQGGEVRGVLVMGRTLELEV